MCDSPQLNAAYHVLHRLLMPRHPPCALQRLILTFSYRSMPFLVRHRTAYRPARATLVYVYLLGVPATRAPAARDACPWQTTRRAPLPAYFTETDHHVKEQQPPTRRPVELAGLEPATPCLQSRCSTS